MPVRWGLIAVFGVYSAACSRAVDETLPVIDPGALVEGARIAWSSGPGFGACYAGAICEGTIELENWCGGNANLTVRLEEELSDCTNADESALFCLDSGAFELKAGEKRGVRAQYRPRMPDEPEDWVQPGSQVTARAVFEGPGVPPVEVRFSGSAIEPFECETSDLDFGGVCPGDCATRAIYCRNAGPETLVVRSVRVFDGEMPTERFTVSGPQEVEVPPGQSISWDVGYCSITPLYERANVLIWVESARTPARTVAVRVSALSSRGGLWTAPHHLSFGLFRLDEPAQRRIELGSCGDLSLVGVALRVEEGTPVVTVPDLFAPRSFTRGQRQMLTIDLMAQMVGVVEATLVFLTDDPGRPETEVSIRGEGINLPPPACWLERRRVAFGLVESGMTVRRAFELHNPGNAPCVFDRPVLWEGDSAGFSLPAPGLPIMIAPDERASVEVAFDAGATGIQEQIIEIKGESQGPFPFLFDAQIPICAAVY